LWQRLVAHLNDPGMSREKLRDEVLSFRRTHHATPQALSAASLLKTHLPSALDALSNSNISDHDRFPWQPQGLVQVLGEHRGRHWGGVRCSAFSPDGKLVATGGEDKVIRIWDTATMRERLALLGHTGTVHWLAFEKDGTLTSCASDHTVRRWDVATGKEI